MCYMLQEFTQLQLSPKYRRLEICFMGCWSDAEAVKAPEGAASCTPHSHNDQETVGCRSSKMGFQGSFCFCQSFFLRRAKRK